MRSNPKTRQLNLMALICYLNGFYPVVFPLLESGLRFLYLLGAIVEIGGVCFSGGSSREHEVSGEERLSRQRDGL